MEATMFLTDQWLHHPLSHMVKQIPMCTVHPARVGRRTSVMTLV